VQLKLRESQQLNVPSSSVSRTQWHFKLHTVFIFTTENSKSEETLTHRQTYVGTTENGHRDTKNMFLLSLVSMDDKFQQGIRKITKK
jgi:hypothetical protein